jgi:hypothetical protein
MSDDGVLKFLAQLNDTDEGKLLGLAANCFQVYSFLEPLLAGDPGTQDVLDAIDALKQEMEADSPGSPSAEPPRAAVNRQIQIAMSVELRNLGCSRRPSASKPSP